MLNIAICDDNILEREINFDKINSYIKNNDLKANILQFQNGEDLIEYINNNKTFFDIIFLDIYMNAMNGIQTAKLIRENDYSCNIIFLTSSNSHAIESYEVRATYYLIKPIDSEKLHKAFQVAIDCIDRSNSKYVIVNNKRGCCKLFYRDILYAESKARIILLHNKQSDVISIYSKLNDFEAKLNDERFLRCHKSFLVNLDYVLGIKDSSFVMENHVTIPISSNIKDVKKIYMNYLLNNLQ